jgi:hypothetical protein
MQHKPCDDHTQFESLSGLWADVLSVSAMSHVAAWQQLGYPGFNDLMADAFSVTNSSQSRSTDSFRSMDNTFNVSPIPPFSNYDNTTDALQYTPTSVASSLASSPPPSPVRSHRDACVQTQEFSVDMLGGLFDDLPICKPSADDWLLFAPRVPSVSSLYSSGTRGRRGREAPTVIGDGVVDDSKRNFVCPEPGCGKGFLRVEHLRRHVRSIHTGEKRIFSSDFAYSTIVSDFV